MSIENYLHQEDVWAHLNHDMKNIQVPFNKKTVFSFGDTPVTLIINMDPGAGLQTGYEFSNVNTPLPLHFTSLRAPIVNAGNFRFLLHEEGVLDKVGKIFGMEDIKIGYEEFDKQLIVKSNDSDRVKKLFSSIEVRNVFQSLNDFSLQITHDEEKEESSMLELMIDKAYTDSKELRGIYEAFISILDNIQKS